jgi:hypothetical protein
MTDFRIGDLVTFQNSFGERQSGQVAYDFGEGCQGGRYLIEGDPCSGTMREDEIEPDELTVLLRQIGY